MSTFTYNFKNTDLLCEAGVYYSHKEGDHLTPVSYTLVRLSDGARFDRKIWVLNQKKVVDLFMVWNRAPNWKIEI